ncbi:LysR family transcriptional regulator [Streptomyces roseifaciens]|uniref:LysR family transcriptional regulator n=1 Tax=Streptomyces roseifaciens TaxID=1488406 RepID=UPI000717ED00|nr:LysR family transcriptional regulator [Streptomyces roseifaciens]
MRGDEEPLLSLSGLLRRLEYFVAVADELHLGRAARRCGVSQPTLSHQMKVLEKELGAELLSRGSRRIALTASGKALQEEAPRLLQCTYSIKARIQQAAAESRRPIRVVFSRSGHALRQREMVAEFRERNAVPVSVESGWSERNINLVRAGQADFAFVRPPVEADDLRMAVVGDVELVKLLPGGAAADRVAEEQAAGELPLIMWPRSLAPGLYDKVLDFVSHERSPQVAWEEPDYINVAAAVASGAGVSYMDRGIAEWMSLSADLRVRPLGLPEPRTDIAVVWRYDQDQELASRFVAACCRIGYADSGADRGCLVR